ncbi:hypothetical protein [Gordonia aquimaris]|uniref:Uncharacterized protein n=1 Tax=Gordonia aquimaris TaxID=2984863 RepID=A0A9X3I6H6_9ACTN|nr:hypothetical protein [Gordonia aquimaris]MCX2966837.1 hypothetical protein [Gordonia aquimaris]
MKREDPALVAQNALAGRVIGISASDSADLDRLGLTSRHIKLAVGELTRALLLAGASVAYGGRLKPLGFTGLMVEELRRYATTRRSALVLYVAWPQHADLTAAELAEVRDLLGVSGRLMLLDPAGNDFRRARGATAGPSMDVGAAQAYTALRRRLVRDTDARVVLGGRLRDGAKPGVLEEVAFSVGSGQPVYIAGGFGGAATAVGARLSPDTFDWLPGDLPHGIAGSLVQQSLAECADEAKTADWSVASDGLGDADRRCLHATHRPGEVASLVVYGLARRFA